MSLLFDSPDAIPIHDEPIYAGGEVVGQITSAAWSYRFARSVALAMITGGQRFFGEKSLPDGTWPVEVEIACTRYPARVSLKPAKEAFADV